MKVFISWSKNSRAVGQAVSDAVRSIFAPAVTTFISQEIYAGARALNLIEEALNDTDFGIICLTRTNQTEQWINYEAGALSRQVGDKRERMGVLMIDLADPSEVNSPLSAFQCKESTSQGFTDLMMSLDSLGPNIGAKILEDRIKSAWPAVESEVQKIKDADPAEKPPVRDLDAKVDQLLELVKSIDGAVNDEQSLLQRKSRQRQKQFLSEVERLLPEKTKMSMQQIAKDSEVLNIDSMISPQLEKQIVDIHKRIVGRFDHLSLSVLDSTFHSGND